MTMTRQGLIHVLQALQHADDMMYHDIHEHGDGLYHEADRVLAQFIDEGIACAAHMLDALYPKASEAVTTAIDEALAENGKPYQPPTVTEMSEEEAAAWYADPANREPQGDPIQRSC